MTALLVLVLLVAGCRAGGVAGMDEAPPPALPALPPDSIAQQRADEEQRVIAEKIAEEHARVAQEATDRRVAVAEMEATASKRELVASCLGRNDPTKCDAAGSADKQDECRAECAEAVAKLSDALVRAALVGCVARFEEARGRKPGVCDFQKASYSPLVWLPLDRQASCDKECERRGRAGLVFDGMHVRCCDGTRSPTCTYAAMRNGCCSHHEGACQEPAPDQPSP